MTETVFDPDVLALLEELLDQVSLPANLPDFAEHADRIVRAKAQLSAARAE